MTETKCALNRGGTLNSMDQGGSKRLANLEGSEGGSIINWLNPTGESFQSNS